MPMELEMAVRVKRPLKTSLGDFFADMRSWLDHQSIEPAEFRKTAADTEANLKCASTSSVTRAFLDGGSASGRDFPQSIGGVIRASWLQGLFQMTTLCDYGHPAQDQPQGSAFPEHRLCSDFPYIPHTVLDQPCCADPA